jgi:hypothetical protein
VRSIIPTSACSTTCAPRIAGTKHQGIARRTTLSLRSHAWPAGGNAHGCATSRSGLTIFILGPLVRVCAVGSLIVLRSLAETLSLPKYVRARVGVDFL